MGQGGGNVRRQESAPGQIHLHADQQRACPRQQHRGALKHRNWCEQQRAPEPGQVGTGNAYSGGELCADGCRPHVCTSPSPKNRSQPRRRSAASDYTRLNVSRPRRACLSRLPVVWPRFAQGSSLCPLRGPTRSPTGQQCQRILTQARDIAMEKHWPCRWRGRCAEAACPGQPTSAAQMRTTQVVKASWFQTTKSYKNAHPRRATWRRLPALRLRVDSARRGSR